MPCLVALPPEALLRQQSYGVFSDFEEFVSGDKFSDLSADSGAAVTNRDQAGGIVRLSSIAIDENEVQLYSTKELFKFAENKPITAVCRLAFAEGNTNAINVGFGLIDAPIADTLVNAGAGPKSSYSGAVFFKTDGSLNWNVEASITTAQTTAELNAINSLDKIAHPGALGATTFQELRIECNPYSSTKQKIDYFIDNVHVYSIDHTYTNGTEMTVWVGLKLGSATIENVDVDYLGAWQKR